MLNEDAYAAWAPDESPWSVWAKPVLFANLVPSPGGAAGIDAELLGRFPAADGRTALVVDLPGARGTMTGIALAARGYRPVPLYNATSGGNQLVDVTSIAQALARGAEGLRSVSLPADAPPAFLLDADRMKGDPRPLRFDNRWMVFPQDFPSAAFLVSRGIERVTVIQEGDAPAEDLAHVLLRWQKAGIAIAHAAPGSPEDERPIVVKPPSRFRRAWYRAVAIMGLKRNNVGGFGALIPEPSSGGG